jgi:hypothetical protein
MVYSTLDDGGLNADVPYCAWSSERELLESEVLPVFYDVGSVTKASDYMRK